MRQKIKQHKTLKKSNDLGDSKLFKIYIYDYNSST